VAEITRLREQADEIDLLLEESANIMSDFVKLLPELGEGRDRLAIKD
jgi:hypothetical protein